MTIKRVDWNLDSYINIISAFLKETKDCPWILINNVVIDSIYGSSACIWNGRRTLDNVFCNKHQILTITIKYLQIKKENYDS